MTTENPKRDRTHNMKVVDFDIPFMHMVGLFTKAMLAAIPALLIAGFIITAMAAFAAVVLAGLIVG